MTQHAEIVAALQVLTQHYLKCQQALEALAPRLVHPDARGDACVELTKILSSIDLHQQTYASVLRRWQTPGFAPSPECRDGRARAQAALESLLRLVQQIEEEATMSKSQIVPALNSAARDQHVRAAYQRASTHH